MFEKKSSLAISPFPQTYHAISYITNDGNSYYRQVTDVESCMAVGSSSSHQDPTEETTEGYTIVYNREVPQYEYAILDSTTGDLIPSGIPVIKAMYPPSSLIPRKHLRRTAEGRALVAMSSSASAPTQPSSRRLLNNKATRHINEYDTYWSPEVETLHRHRTLQAEINQINVLVIPLLFANHAAGAPNERWLPTKEQLTTFFNSDTADATVAPTGSVKKAFNMLSHGNLDITATVVDWITLSEDESYYAAQKRGYDGTYMHQALVEALNYLEDTLNFDFSSFDTNNDGLIDGILFLHSGYGAEFGGVSEDGAYFMDRIWSHTSSIGNDGWTSIAHGVKVHNYPIVSALYDTHQTTIDYWTGQILTSYHMLRVSVVTHELGQFLGLDYHSRSNDVNNLGNWAIMSQDGNAWGFTGDQTCLSLMNPYNRLQLGWLSNIMNVEKADSGSKLEFLPPDNNNGLIVKISDGFIDSSEYLLLEYRKRGSSVVTESCLPYAIGGLAVWHIDETAFVSDDDESAALTTITSDNKKVTEHGVVNLIQADGFQDLEYHYNHGDGGDLFTSSLGVSSRLGPSEVVNDNKGTTITSVVNTDSYQGYSSGWSLENILIDEVTGILSLDLFHEENHTTDTAAPSISNIPTTSPTSSPTWSPVITDAPDATSSPTLQITSAPTEEHVIPERCMDYRHKLFLFELRTDMAGDELSWELINAGVGPMVMAKGGPYPKGVIQKYQYGICLDERLCWVLKIKDKGGNGIDIFQKDPISGHPAGFKVWYNNQLIDKSLPTLSYDDNGGSHTMMISPTFSEIGIPFGEKCMNISPTIPRTEIIVSTDHDIQAGGFMFDIYAKGSKKNMMMYAGLNIQRFWRLYLASNPTDPTKPISIKIYSKTGSYQGYETKPDAWTLIHAQSLVPEAEFFNIEYDAFSTTMDYNNKETPILWGSTRGFYIVTEPPTLLLTHCSDSVGVDHNPSRIWRRFDTIDIMSGLIVKPEFGGLMETLDPASHTACISTSIWYDTLDIKPALEDPTSQCPEGYTEKIFNFDLELPADEVRTAGISWVIEDMTQKTQKLFSPVYDASDAGTTKHYHNRYCMPSSNNKSCFRFLLKDSSGLGAIGHRATFDGYLVSEDHSGNLSVIDPYDEIGGDFGEYCGIGLSSQGLETLHFGVNGSYLANGIMFDTKGNNNPEDELHTIFRLNGLHLESSSQAHNIKVYTKNGSYRGYENDPSAWTEVLSTPFEGGGRKRITVTQTFLSPRVAVLGSTTQAFYVLAEDGAKLYTSNLEGSTTSNVIGTTWKSFPQLDAYVGNTCASSTPFVGCHHGVDAGTVVAGFDGIWRVGFVMHSSDTDLLTHSPTASPREPTPSPTSSPSISQMPTSSSTPSTRLITNVPSMFPSSGEPTSVPTITGSPSHTLTEHPTISASPSEGPTAGGTPTGTPSETPTELTSSQPSSSPTTNTSMVPSIEPSISHLPSAEPSVSKTPSVQPSLSALPSTVPSMEPSLSASPQTIPSVEPSLSASPSMVISTEPSVTTSPSSVISVEPSVSTSPSSAISMEPSLTASPSIVPSAEHSLSASPSMVPSVEPSVSASPSMVLSMEPSLSASPSMVSSVVPSLSASPSIVPSAEPSLSALPSTVLSMEPSLSVSPSTVLSTEPSLSALPSTVSSLGPSLSASPSMIPSMEPSLSALPSMVPSVEPSLSASPLTIPSSEPSLSTSPHTVPSAEPSLSASPSQVPSVEPSLSASPLTALSMEPSLSASPSTVPSGEPSLSASPSTVPSIGPSLNALPSTLPSAKPSLSASPTTVPSVRPSLSASPTTVPSVKPTISALPSIVPSVEPSLSASPSTVPSEIPTITSTSGEPFAAPSAMPSGSTMPSSRPSSPPPFSTMPSGSTMPSSRPSSLPSFSTMPSLSPSDASPTSTTPSASPIALVWEQLYFSDFESSVDRLEWTDGGTDAKWSKNKKFSVSSYEASTNNNRILSPIMARKGRTKKSSKRKKKTSKKNNKKKKTSDDDDGDSRFSMHLTPSSYMQHPFDVSLCIELTINFYFSTSKLEGGELFILKMFDGITRSGTWHDIKVWEKAYSNGSMSYMTAVEEMKSNASHEVSVTNIDSSYFTSGAILRFEFQGQKKNDSVYIDNVEVMCLIATNN